MESNTQSLTREQQADKLLAEGLFADREELLMRLNHIGFYRLNGYAHTFRERGGRMARCCPGSVPVPHYAMCGTATASTAV